MHQPPTQNTAVFADEEASWVLVFGSRAALSVTGIVESLQARFPKAQLLMGSTAGEILGTEVTDDTIAITAIQFEKTTVRSSKITLSPTLDRRAAGKSIATSLLADDLALVFVLADGQNVNGSELVMGLNEVLGGRIPVVGGLAGDGAAFESTLVGLNEAPASGNIAAIGLYGRQLQVRFGSQGGWETFGPQRKVTAARGNVLYELDGVSALDLYKSYLGEHAAELPAAGLRFPLSINLRENGATTVRTLLSIDAQEDSLTFAGDVPQGAVAHLMRGSSDKLLQGAKAAALACKSPSDPSPELAILVSCVGRKLILNQRIEEEIEEVQHVLGKTAICGFYAYGEISPTGIGGHCELHNQTMTITTLSES